MATKTVEKTGKARQLAQKLDTINQQLGVVQGFLKALEGPASRAGLTPEEFIAKMSKDNPGGSWGISGNGAAAHAAVEPTNKNMSVGWGKFLAAAGCLALDKVSMTEKRKAAQILFDPQEKGGFGIKTKAALAEGSGVTGGYTVPTQFSNQLLKLAGEESIVEGRASSMPLTNRSLLVPSLDMTTNQGSGNPAYLGGIQARWESEASTRSETEPTFRQTELIAHELSFYCVASNNLLADSAMGLEALLTELFSKAIAWYTDYAFLRGDGVGKPLGILNAAATLQVTRSTASHFRWPDVSNMMARLHAGSWKGGKTVWLIHQTVFPDLAQMNDNSGYNSGYGRLVWLPLDKSAQESLPSGGGSGGAFSLGTLFGIPVIVTEKLPALGTTGCVALIDFSKYLLGKKMEISIEVSPHVRFLNNQMVWRIIWRGDGQPWLNGPVTLADGTNTVSPFVTLTQ